MQSQTPGSSGASWMLYILPFMEHTDIFDHWNFSYSVAGVTTPTSPGGQNPILAQTDIREFYCPSRRNGVSKSDATIMFKKWTSGGTDYGGCVGHNDFWVNALTVLGDHEICYAEYTVPNAAAESNPAIAL